MWGTSRGPPNPPTLGIARETRAAPRDYASRRGLEGPPGPGWRLQLAPALGDFGEEIHGLCHALELAVLVGLMSER
jgi:hypothetical protein